MTTRDCNGQVVTSSVKRDARGRWGATVWSGHVAVTTVRRYHYASRDAARHADISDDIGKRGRVA